MPHPSEAVGRRCHRRLAAQPQGAQQGLSGKGQRRWYGGRSCPCRTVGLDAWHEQPGLRGTRIVVVQAVSVELLSSEAAAALWKHRGGLSTSSSTLSVAASATLT